MKKSLIGLFLLSTVFGFQTEALEHTKILAAYWGLKSAEQAEEQLRLLKTNGLNTALVKDGNYEIRLDLWRAWAEIAQKYKIRLAPVLNFAGVTEIEQLTGQYRPYIDSHGKVFNTTPCPLDANYWNLAIGQRFMRLAQLGSSVPIDGLVFDTEMYGSNQSLYRDACFCDDCWAIFCKTLSQNMLHLPKERRFAYLVEHQFVNRYEEVQKQRLHDILVHLRNQIYAVDSGLFFGFLAYRANWFYAALIQGLGTIKQPVNVFTESSYVSGYTPYIAEEQATVYLPSVRQTVRYIPGLWLGRFFPHELPSQLYAMAMNTDGYWLFTTDSLWDDTPRQGPYAVHGSADLYWKAFHHANRMIEVYAAAPDTYAPDVPPLYSSSFYHSSSRKLTTPSSLQEFLQKVLPFVSENSSEAATITYRGRTLFHGYKTNGGVIDIHHVPIGKYSDDTHYILFNSRGEIMQEGRLNRQNPSKSLLLTTEDAQLLSLLTDSGANATRVAFSDMPYLVEASTTFPCATNNSPHSYYLYVPTKKQIAITIRARCTGQESALLRVQSADVYLKQQIEIHDFTEMSITDAINTSAPNQLMLQFRPMKSNSVQKSRFEQDLWKISLSPVLLKPFEDVTVYVYNYPFPYLLPE